MQHDSYQSIFLFTAIPTCHLVALSMHGVDRSDEVPTAGSAGDRACGQNADLEQILAVRRDGVYQVLETLPGPQK